MKFSSGACAVAAAALLFTGGASAQLKLRSGPQLKLPASAASPASPPAQPPAGSQAAEKEKAGALAAAGWLLLLDRRDWGTAWETTSSVFRSTVPLDKWMDAIPKVRAPLGNLVDRKQAEAVYKTTLQGRPDGEYVTVVFEAKFDQRQVQEVVTTVREPDGRWRVTGYSTQ